MQRLNNRTVTANDVLREFEAIARTQGDRRNPGVDEEVPCTYTARSGEHCVAGQVLVNLGLPVPDERSGSGFIYANDRDNPVEFNRWPVNRLCNGGPSGDRFAPLTEAAEFSRGAVELLAEAQTQADDGETWLDAIDYAIARYEEGQ